MRHAALRDLPVPHSRLAGFPKRCHSLKLIKVHEMPFLKQGATLPQPSWPGIETERLILRQWRASDIAENTTMLGDPLSARFITADRKPVTEVMVGWRNAAIMAGHWVLHGFGMLVVEEKSSGKSPAVSARSIRRSGLASRSAGGSPTHFAARAVRSRRREPRSTGRLRPSTSTRSFTAP